MLSLPEACDFVVHKARAFTPLATNTLIPNRTQSSSSSSESPAESPHPSSSISTAAGSTSPARCRPAPASPLRVLGKCRLFPLFAATWLPHLQQQFLSLFIVLHVANLHAAKNKKGAPISRSALLFNVARVFRVSRVPTLCRGDPRFLTHPAHTARFVRPA